MISIDRGELIIYSNGTVYSKRRRRFLLICPNSTGYGYLHIRNKSFRVHRIIAECFIPNPENKPCVNHKDGNKLNNDVSNLEWCTHSHNNSHAIRTGLNKANAKLKEWQVKAIRLFGKYKLYSQKEIATTFRIHPTCISKILSGKSFSHNKSPV